MDGWMGSLSSFILSHIRLSLEPILLLCGWLLLCLSLPQPILSPLPLVHFVKGPYFWHRKSLTFSSATSTMLLRMKLMRLFWNSVGGVGTSHWIIADIQYMIEFFVDRAGILRASPFSPLIDNEQTHLQCDNRSMRVSSSFRWLPPSPKSKMGICTHRHSIHLSNAKLLWSSLTCN